MHSKYPAIISGSDPLGREDSDLLTVGYSLHDLLKDSPHIT